MTARRPRRAAAAALLAVTATWAAAPALADFANVVQTSGTSFATYTVPVPGGIHCTGLGLLSSSRIAWNAVTPPAGDSVVYVITAPNSNVTTQAGTTFTLPVVLLTGQYRVQSQISSGWRSLATTITVTSVLSLYLCSTP